MSTKQFFDEYSSKYNKKRINRFFNRNYYWILDHLDNIENKKILDVGCGPAEFCKILDENFKNLKIFGIDISEKMIEKSKELLPLGNFNVGDVHELPFEDNSFDYIFNTSSFHHYEDPLVALNQMYRVLKKDGTLYLLDSIKDSFIFSFMPWYWDFKDSKYCYSKHLYAKEFRNLFSKSFFVNTKYVKFYKSYPAIHLLCIAKKGK